MFEVSRASSCQDGRICQFYEANGWAKNEGYLGLAHFHSCAYIAKMRGFLLEAVFIFNVGVFS
jgi:hypothetical protein